MLYPRMQTRPADWHCEHVCCPWPAIDQLICSDLCKAAVWLVWKGGGLGFALQMPDPAAGAEQRNCLASYSLGGIVTARCKKENIIKLTSQALIYSFGPTLRERERER